MTNRKLFDDRRRQRGTSVVEMAIVLPLLLMLVFGIGEFGLMFTQWQTLTNAAREGARTGVLWRGTSCTAATVKTEISTAVTSYMANTGIADGEPHHQLDRRVRGQRARRSPVTAQVPYAFAALPGLAGLQSSITLSATSRMRNE